ncbi:hypothetical protein LPB72_10775 [Hydrogenophaga crassostreae]|uniref:Porin domain-containing protein n=1 Tax=Hydrogenophaga crassostreae TaxID=1763535 RepID=A0A163CF64_9BURK|nr:hypothetical protein [Hydrogenophaga crassostreae]AOW13497.1 hypothetical protein LPB072_12150 [Hydrogenophaga crassostreae]OAD41788.1 hypothetical protein LPB72_10775 [Hydrogenophaga crassostreae]
MNSKIASLLVLASQPFVWLPAMAQNTLTVPMEIVRVSNPELSAESSGSVTLYRLHPQYTLQSIQGSSRTELTLGGMIEKSSNTDLSANRTLPSVRVLWENSSPVDVFGLRASLEEASTRETEFAEFGRVTRDSTQRTGTLGGTWTRNLTARSFLELAASHARVSYDTALLVDYSETRGSVAYRFESGPSSRYALTSSVARLKPSGGGTSVSRGEVGLGYEVDLREDVTLNARAGVVHTSTPRGKTDPVGALRLAYTGERVGYALEWVRDVSLGGTLGGYTRSETLGASFTYPFTVDTSLALGYSQARSLEVDRDVGVTVYARVRSELTRFWAFTMGLENRRAKSSVTPSASGNAFAVGFVYAHPDF